MKTASNHNNLAIIIALTLSFLLFFTSRTYALTSISSKQNQQNFVKIESKIEESTNSQSKSTIKNRVEINGEVYVDEEKESASDSDSEIKVNIKNNTGTIEYKSNGDKKVIKITPKTELLSDKNDKKVSSSSANAKDINSKNDSRVSNSENNKNNKNLIDMFTIIFSQFLGKLESVFGR